MKQKKLKRLLSLTLSAAMVVSMISIPNIVMADASEEVAAESALIVNAENDLDKVLRNASEGSTINMEVDSQITADVNKRVTINTNGHVITIPELGKDATSGQDLSVTLTNVNITNNKPAEITSWSEYKENHTVLDVKGSLIINGGEYKTASVKLIHVEGTVKIQGNATFTCDSTLVTRDQLAELNNYDGASLIEVYGAGAQLVMENGTVNADIGNGTNCGMYGIYVLNGGTVELGKKNQDGTVTGPTIRSMFSVVGMNKTTAPGSITISGGSYESTAICEKADELKYNSVIFLPASATVKIEGGTFVGKKYAISIPYTKINDKSLVRLKLDITGGTYTVPAGGKVFYIADTENMEKIKVSVEGGEFSTDISKELPEDSVVSGKGVYASGNKFVIAESASFKVAGKYYSDFTSALEQAKSATDKKVELTGDVELTGAPVFGKVSVETNGHMITIPKGEELNLNQATFTNKEVAIDAGENESAWSNDANNRTIFDVKGTLNINGGSYTTKGARIMVVRGTASISGNAALACNAEESEISSLKKNQYYDGASLVKVTKNGNLTVANTTITAKAGKDNDGMYGIYVCNGGELTLNDGTKIESLCASIAMNEKEPSGKITINGGEYSSLVSAGGDEARFNAVLFLPATGDVTINEGTFTAKGSSDQHVISLPCSEVDGKYVKLNLNINGGTFDAGTNGDIFYDGYDANDKQLQLKVNVRGGIFSKEPTHLAGCIEKQTLADGKLQYVLKQTGHIITWKPEDKATCWKEGVIGHYECDGCHRMYSTKPGADTTAADELSADEVVIPQLRHKAVLQTASPAGTNSCINDINLKDYYECPNCGRCYETPEAAEADTEGTGGSEDAFKGNYKKPATGHTYTENSISIDSTGLETYIKENDFVSGKANGVTATLTCGKESCAMSTPVDADNISVTMTESEDESPSDCTKETKLIYNITVSIPAEEGKEAITKEATQEVIIPAGQHSVDEDTITWDTTKFNISAFKAGESNGVTVSDVTCTKCKQELDVTVEVKALTAGFDPAKLSCETKYDFEAAIKVNGVQLSSKQFSSFAPHTLNRVQAYTAPTCTTYGQRAYYQCEYCHRYYSGEDSAEKGEPIVKDADIAGMGADKVLEKVKEATKLDMRLHTFTQNSGTIRWKDDNGKETDAAEAIITCESCHKSFTVDLGKPTTTEPPAKCGEKKTLSYPVTMEFSQKAVTTKGEGEGATLGYEEEEGVNYPKTFDYTATLTKESVQHHILKSEDGTMAANVEAEWANSSEKYNTLKNGIKVTVTCATDGCNEKLVLISQNGITTIDDENSNLLDDEEFTYMTPVVVVTEADTGNKPATCQEDGQATYDVTVMYRTGDKKWVTINDEAKTVTTSIQKDTTAHQWTEPECTWSPVYKEGTTEPVMVTMQVGEGDDAVEEQVPQYAFTATYHCSVKDCTEAKTITQKVGNDAPESESTQGLSIKFVVPSHQPASCVQVAKTEYIATIYDGDKVVATSKKTYTAKSLGHDYKTDFEWKFDEGSEDKTAYAKVTAAYGCTRCHDGESTYELLLPKEDTTLSTPHDNGEERYLEVTVKGTPATCDTSGSMHYEAELYDKTDKLIASDAPEDLESKALGHEYLWTLKWTRNTPQEGADVTAQSCTAVLEKICKRSTAEKPCKGSGTNGTVERASILVTFNHDYEPATCSATGKASWVVTGYERLNRAEFAEDLITRDDAGEITGFNTDAFMMTLPTPINADKHIYGDVSVVWDTDAISSGATTVDVTCTRTCKAPGNTSHTAPDEVTLQATIKENSYDSELVVVDEKAGTIAPVHCSKGYAWEYEITDTELQKIEGWTNLPTADPDGDKGGDKLWSTYKVAVEAVSGSKNHKLKMVPETGSQDSCISIYTPKYYECSICSKKFKNSICGAWYEPEELQGIMKGHSYGNPKFTWKTGKIVSVTFVCQNSGCTADDDGHNYTMNATLDDTLTEPVVDPKCAQSGEIVTMPGGRVLEAGQGYELVLVQCKVEDVPNKMYFAKAEEAEDGSRFYEDMVYRAVPAVDHSFKDGACEWCGTTQGKEVVFKDANGNIISTEHFSSADDIKLATCPEWTGYEFEGWKVSNTGTPLKPEAARQYIVNNLSTEGKIELQASYTLIAEDKVTVKQEYYNGTLTKSVASTAYSVGEKCTVTAAAEYKFDDTTTCYFDHWERKEDGQETYIEVSVNRAYSFYVKPVDDNGEVILRAVYRATQDADAKKPTIAITDTYAETTSAGKNRVSFSANVSIPEGYDGTIAEVGMLYIRCEDSESVQEQYEKMTLDNWAQSGWNHTKKQFTSVNSATYTLALSIASGQENYRLMVRPYVIVEDADGNQDVIYAEKISSTTYNEKAGKLSRKGA